MSYKAITTAEEGWFFVQTDPAQIAENDGRIIILRIAAWALTEEGQVYGLVGVDDAPLGVSATKVITQLHPPSARVLGMYKYISDFNPKQLQYLANLHPGAVSSSLLGKI